MQGELYTKYRNFPYLSEQRQAMLEPHNLDAGGSISVLQSYKQGRPAMPWTPTPPAHFSESEQATMKSLDKWQAPGRVLRKGERERRLRTASWTALLWPHNGARPRSCCSHLSSARLFWLLISA